MEAPDLILKDSRWKRQLFEFDIEVPEVYPSIEAQMVSIVTPPRSTSRYDGSVEHWLLEYLRVLLRVTINE